MIALFTDFGPTGPYVGQMHAAIARSQPAPTVIDLMHDAPAFDPTSAAHLLAALADYLPAGTVVAGVVDPGVGTERRALVVEADGQWFVGPDNGLFDVVAARAAAVRRWRITREPDTDAATFHGRDLFAPVAAAIVRGEPVPGEPIEDPVPPEAGRDRGAVIYIDAYGNAVTGLRATGRSRTGVVTIGERHVPGARTFAHVVPGDVLWFPDSMGLVELAVNQGSAAGHLGLCIGTAVEWSEP